MSQIDLQTPGKRAGDLWVRARNNDSAYRRVASPYTIIVNGSGPVVLAMAGVHGDECDGQVLINKLISAIQPQDIKGTLILVPCANPMACDANQCTSPEDNGNLFRSFIQTSTFNPTELMAKKLEDEFISRCDLVLDFHSGGKSSIYEPCTVLFKTQDENINQKAIRAIEYFDFPCLVKAAPQDPKTFITSAAHRHNVPYVAFELGGSNTVNKQSLKKATEGIFSNVKALSQDSDVARYDVEYWASGKENDYLLAPVAGLFEANFALSDDVLTGQNAGQMHTPLVTVGSTRSIEFSESGRVFSMRTKAPCLKGDCLAELARKIQKDDLKVL